MNRQQFLLLKLIEECCEVQKPASKAIQFGMQSYNPFDVNKTTNQEMIEDELNDLIAIVEMLVEENVISTDWQKYEKKLRKKNKVNDFYELSKDLNNVE